MAKKTISNTFTVNTVEDGESAPYYFQEWFAWSNDSTTASVTTAPTIAGSWATSIPAQGNYSYLWRKLVRHVWNDNTRQYTTETPQYFRMSGTDGTSIHTRGQVANASSRTSDGHATIITDSGTQTITLSDGDAVTQLDNGHLYQWVTEGGGKWLDLGQFKGESGVTYYTHIAWATNVTISGSTVTVTGFVTTKSPNDTTHIWMGTYVDTNSGQDSANASKYTWSNTKGVQGNAGKDAQYIYLKGTARDANNTITTTIPCVVNVNGGTNAATVNRGLNLVTINRQTLAVVESINYDTYGEASGVSGATGITNLIAKLNSLDDSVFVCLVGFDAIGWSNDLIAALQGYGMGDLPYTTTGRYPFLFIGYKNLGKGNGLTRMRNVGSYTDVAELSVYVANGALAVKDGDDGVSYCFVFTKAAARVDENNIVTAELAGYAYKYVGGVRSELKSTTIRYGYILTDSDTYADTTTDNNGFFDVGTWFNGDDITDYGKNSPSIFAAIVIGGTVVHAEMITISVKGSTGGRGKVGRFFYFAGTFNSQDNDPTHGFVVNDAQAPYFEHTENGQKRYHVFNYDTNGTYTMAQMWAISNNWNNKPWEVMTSDFKYLITEAIFAQFAHLGSFIINEDFFLSQHGTLFYNNSGTIVSYDAATWDSSHSQKAYTYFNVSDPMADSMPTVGNYKFRPMKCIDALTGEEWMAEGKVHVDADGNVEVTGVIRATTLYQSFIDYNPLWGSGQYVTEISASELLSDIGGTLPNILWISSRDIESHREDLYTAFEIHLPNPSLYDGHQIEIICSKRAHYTSPNGDESWNPSIYLHLPDSSGHDTIVWSNVQEAESELNILNYQIRLVSIMKNNVQKWFVLDSRDCEFTYQ